MTRRWQYGERVVRREVLHGQVWMGFSTYVVLDTDDLLVVFLAGGSEFSFPDWPFDRWEHPWLTAGHVRWTGHGKLMMQRPGEAYSVDLFWHGEERTFSGWYLNLQDPPRRYDGGFDTLDHELDFWMPSSGGWTIKDKELFEHRIAEGRYSEERAVEIREQGRRIETMLRDGDTWWDPSWAVWSPPETWGPLDLPDGWASVPPVP